VPCRVRRCRRAARAIEPNSIRRARNRHRTRGGYQVVIADLNKDGKPDIIALASGLPELLWYENPFWQKHVLATGVRS
jgi:FG-GAP repeat.